MKTNLKPCPFCGSVAKLTEKELLDESDLFDLYYNVGCNKCSAEVGSVKAEWAIRSWNTRHDEMTLKKVLLLIPELAIKIFALAILAAGVYWIFA